MKGKELRKVFLEELEPLLKIYSPTGREKEEMLPYLIDKLEKLGFKISTDPSGMLLGLRNVSASIKTPGLCAHYDTVDSLQDDENFRKKLKIEKLTNTTHPDFCKYQNKNRKTGKRLCEVLGSTRNNLEEGLEYLWAPNIHLGLDCKVGIAMILTLIDLLPGDKPIAVLFTAGEEKGVFRQSVDNEEGYTLNKTFRNQLNIVSYCLSLDRQGRRDLIKRYKDRDLLNKDQIEAWSNILNMNPDLSKNRSDAYGLAGLGIPCANISNGVYGEHDYEDFLVVDYAVEIMHNVQKWLNVYSSDLSIR